MMENSQANEYREFYNDKLIQNYYDPERIEKRDHPLNAQRIIYLYEILYLICDYPHKHYTFKHFEV